MTTLLADDLAYLPGLRRPPSSMPGTETLPGLTLLEWVAAELASGEGTPDRRAWLSRFARRHHLT